MNTLIVIGYLGTKRAYLNVPCEEAVRRFEKTESCSVDNDGINLNIIEFKDEFFVYDAWEIM